MTNLTDYNTYLFDTGNLNKAYEIFGSHLIKNEFFDIVGTLFRVYAPNAKIVSVVGDFNNWDSRVDVLKKVNDIGIYEIYIPKNLEWNKYKYCIITSTGETLFKSDPYAFFSDYRPETSSKVYDIDGYFWHDEAYINDRHNYDPIHSPLSIYEMNIGSWMKKPDGSFNKYNEVAPLLVSYLKMMGYNAVEFMPLTEFPLDESWGYQGTGYFSATSRYGVPKDLMYLIDELHKENIKVIIDWVPGHISKDSHGLYNFDGSYLYEYNDEYRRENVVWGTANLDFSKNCTRSFMLSSAMFFMEYFHVDGFRLDAVSNIYYYLGDKNNGINNEGINFLKDLTRMIKSYSLGIIISAEDSTTFENVTRSADDGGIGFDFKWNMGWMNDTLKYFSLDPIYRKYHHDLITFSMMYEYSENFLLPLSHDEIVHGKGSLINKMPGDYFSKFANLRALLGFMYTHPGKKLTFMGSEFAQFSEWNELSEIDWFLLQYDKHKSYQRYVRDLNLIYLNHDSLFINDDNRFSFNWIDPSNKDQSVFIFERRSNNETLIVCLNLTPNSYMDYRIGIEGVGEYEEILNSDKDIYGGSNLYNGLNIKSENIPMHNRENSIKIILSPLSISIFKYKG